jgi:hypothetical protein
MLNSDKSQRIDTYYENAKIITLFDAGCQSDRVGGDKSIVTGYSGCGGQLCAILT